MHCARAAQLFFLFVALSLPKVPSPRIRIRLKTQHLFSVFNKIRIHT